MAGELTERGLPRPAAPVWRSYLDEWDRSLRAANRPWSTRSNYQLAVTQLATFLASASDGSSDAAEDPTDVRRADVERFLAWMIETRSASTALNKYKGLQQFFRYLVEDEEMTRHPMDRIRQPNQPEKLVPVVADDELSRLLPMVTDLAELPRIQPQLPAISSAPRADTCLGAANVWNETSRSSGGFAAGSDACHGTDRVLPPLRALSGRLNCQLYLAVRFRALKGACCRWGGVETIMLLDLSGGVRRLGDAVSIVGGVAPLIGRAVWPSRSAWAGRRARFAAVVVLALAATGGCVGGEQTNGLERKSAAEVQQAAAAALRDSKYVRVTGMRLFTDRSAVLDLRLQDKLAHITGTLAGSQFEIITVGENLYLKGEQAAWRALKAPPSVQGFAGRWVQLNSRQVKLDPVSLESLVATVSGNGWRESTVQQATLDGKKVVVLSRPDGSRLYVANTDSAYPVRIEDKSFDSQIDFTEYGVESHITAPTDALSNAFTTDESAWLDAIKRLHESMNDAFVNAPPHITSTALATLADRLRSCSSELARIGPPTDRLQPAHTLVQQACARYDQGAQCFTTAADIGIPLAGSDADKRQTEALDCGFASSDAGTTLADAINKGDEIKSQVN